MHFQLRLDLLKEIFNNRAYPIPKFVNGGMIRNLFVQIQPKKPSETKPVVNGFFQGWIAQVIPLLQ